MDGPDDDLKVIAEADAYLQQLRFGGTQAAESTIKAYAGALALGVPMQAHDMAGSQR